MKTKRVAIQVYWIHPPIESLTTNLHAAGRQDTWIPLIHLQCSLKDAHNVNKSRFSFARFLCCTVRMPANCHFNFFQRSPDISFSLSSSYTQIGDNGNLGTNFSLEYPRLSPVLFRHCWRHSKQKGKSFFFLRRIIIRTKLNGVAITWWIYRFIHQKFIINCLKSDYFVCQQWRQHVFSKTHWWTIFKCFSFLYSPLLNFFTFHQLQPFLLITGLHQL